MKRKSLHIGNTDASSCRESREYSLLYVSLVQGACGLGSSQGLVEHDSVHETHITELAGNSEPGDWRLPLIDYFKDPSQTRDRNIRQQALTYILLNDDSYRRIINALCNCLNSYQSRLSMGEVHEAIY